MIDASTYLEERDKMCNSYKDCRGCPLFIHEGFDCTSDYWKYDEIVNKVERWSKELPKCVSQLPSVSCEEAAQALRSLSHAMHKLRDDDDVLNTPEDYIVYMSGPITGTDDAAERFETSAKQLRLLGFRKIINPQKLCEVYQYEADYECYMEACLVFLNHANVIYMLKGCEKSPGACREKDKTIAKGITVIYE